MLSPDERTDVELLGAMCAGDEAAFTTLYRRHHGSVYRFATYMSGSAAVAEDVTQEVFLVLMRDGERFDEARGTLQAFLLGVARNHVRRAFAREQGYAPLEIDEERATGDDPFEQLARDEAMRRLHRAINSLPARFREIVVLCELHEMSYEEAAAVIGCAVGTVRSRLHRARQMLGAKMRDAHESSSPVKIAAACLI